MNNLSTLDKSAILNGVSTENEGMQWLVLQKFVSEREVIRQPANRRAQDAGVPKVLKVEQFQIRCDNYLPIQKVIIRCQL